MKYIFAICFLCLSSSVLKGQTQEIVNLSFQKFYGHNDEGDTFNTNVFNTALLVGFPTKKDGKSTLFFRPSYHQRIVENSIETRLYKPELIAGINRIVNDTWSYRVFGVLRLASDFKDIDSEHYQPGGGSIVTYQKQKNLNISAGIYIRNQPDNFIVFPLLGIDYTFGNDKWYLNALLPQSALLRYNMGKIANLDTYIGLRASYTTERYKNSAQFAPVDYTELTQFQSQLVFEIQLLKGLYYYGKAGLLSFQKYEQFNDSEVVINEGDEKVNDVLSIEFGIAFRL